MAGPRPERTLPGAEGVKPVKADTKAAKTAKPNLDFPAAVATARILGDWLIVLSAPRSCRGHAPSALALAPL